MVVDLRSLFHRQAPDSPETDIDPSSHRGDGLESDFHDLILDQLAKGGISDDCIQLEVRTLGRGGDGRTVYTGMLRLVKWDATSALRLLLGLPLLQARVRRAIRGSWLYDLTHFSGLWLHPSGQFEDSPAMNDLRVMILHLEKSQAALLGAAHATEHSVWSVPQDLAEPEPPRG